MLGFLAILGVSAGLIVLTQIFDIECVNQPEARAAEDEAYPHGVVLGGLR